MSESMARTITLIHPPGPNREALAVYLAGRRWAVADAETLEDWLTSDLGGTTVVIAHATRLTDEGVARWTRRSSPPLLALCPDEASAQRLGTSGEVTVMREPYWLEDVAHWIDRHTPEVRATAATETVERDMRTILKILSHALAGPIAAARGWLQILRNDIAANDPVQRNVVHVQSELDEMERIVHLLGLSGDVDWPSPRPVSLNDVIGDAIVSSGVRTIEVETDLGVDLPEVSGDVGLFRTCFEQMLLAAAEPGGRCEGIRIVTRFERGAVVATLRELGRTLSQEEIRSLRAPGEALLYNTLIRGLAYPVASRILRNYGATLEVDAHSAAAGRGAEIVVTVRFGLAREGTRGQGRAGAEHTEDDG